MVTKVARPRHILVLLAVKNVAVQPVADARPVHTERAVIAYRLFLLFFPLALSFKDIDENIQLTYRKMFFCDEEVEGNT